MEAQLEQIEVETMRCGNHYLPVNDATVRESGETRVVQVWKIAIERTRIAALDEHVGAAAKDDRAKAIPFGLVQQSASGGKLVGQLCEHRLDGRLNGKFVGAHDRRVPPESIIEFGHVENPPAAPTYP